MMSWKHRSLAGAWSLQMVSEVGEREMQEVKRERENIILPINNKFLFLSVFSDSPEPGRSRRRLGETDNPLYTSRCFRLMAFFVFMRPSCGTEWAPAFLRRVIILFVSSWLVETQFGSNSSFDLIFFTGQTARATFSIRRRLLTETGQQVKLDTNLSNLDLHHNNIGSMGSRADPNAPLKLIQHKKNMKMMSNNKKCDVGELH